MGTGMVGRALAGRLAEVGHDVVIGTRDPAATMARTGVDAMGTGPYSRWQAAHPAETKRAGLRLRISRARGTRPANHPTRPGPRPKP